MTILARAGSRISRTSCTHILSLSPLLALLSSCTGLPPLGGGFDSFIILLLPVYGLLDASSCSFFKRKGARTLSSFIKSKTLYLLSYALRLQGPDSNQLFADNESVNNTSLFSLLLRLYRGWPPRACISAVKPLLFGPFTFTLCSLLIT